MEHGPQDHFTGSHYGAHKITGPFDFLHPTKRYLPLPKPDAKPATDTVAAAKSSGASDDSSPPQNHVYHEWRSRDNRKGRHAVVISPELAAKAGVGTPTPTNTVKEILRGLAKLVLRYPVWDVSYDVATVFTLGSIVWVINGFFEWLPLQDPSTEFNGEVDQGGGITAFIGATIFEFGSILLMLEAVNENRSDCFGWALEEAWEKESGSLVLKHEDHCGHHHRNKKAWLQKSMSRVNVANAAPSSVSESGTADATDTADAAGEAAVQEQTPDPNSATSSSPAVAQEERGDSRKGHRTWSWWPSWYELRTHYFRDIGFLACSSQMFGATVFWISGLTGLAPILSSLSVTAENGAFWVPQVIGGSGFIVSSALFMLEVQEKWWKPAPRQLGWHIGFWNLIGAIGFTLCGALGFGSATSDAVAYAGTLSTFIGSWAFLIGSVVQWYESLDKYPVSILADFHHIASSNRAAAATAESARAG